MMPNYQIEQIDGHTWKLADPFKTYLYLLEGTERALLIDAGNGFSGLQEAVKELEQLESQQKKSKKRGRER